MGGQTAHQGRRPPGISSPGAFISWATHGHKPNSVPGPNGPLDGHFSRAAVAGDLLHATRSNPRTTDVSPKRNLELLALARGGVCRAPSVTGTGGALLPHRFTLACDRGRIGGLFSVALSLTRSPRAGGCYPPPSSCRARTFLEAGIGHAIVRSRAQSSSAASSQRYHLAR